MTQQRFPSQPTGALNFFAAHTTEVFAYKVCMSIILLVALMFAAPEVMAQDVPAEWTGPWCRVIKLLTGPIAIALLVAATVVAGLIFAFGEGGSTASRSAGIVLGGTLAVSAPTLVKWVWGVSALGC